MRWLIGLIGLIDVSGMPPFCYNPVWTEVNSYRSPPYTTWHDAIVWLFLSFNLGVECNRSGLMSSHIHNLDHDLICIHAIGLR
jgi:hypothetical protein